MKIAVIVFPGSNCDRDVRVALEGCGAKVDMVWHTETSLSSYDLVVVPGGFSYGDYLRSGAMAAHSPIMQEVVKHANAGKNVLGICNGFQILTEAGLLPGTLMRNQKLKFICKDVRLKVMNNNTIFTSRYEKNQVITVPIAHHDGNYNAAPEVLDALQQNDQIAFCYVDENGDATQESNPNGSMLNIAGIVNKQKNVLGMMPHPERLWEAALGGEDGKALFESILAVA